MDGATTRAPRWRSGRARVAAGGGRDAREKAADGGCEGVEIYGATRRARRGRRASRAGEEDAGDADAARNDRERACGDFRWRGSVTGRDWWIFSCGGRDVVDRGDAEGRERD